MQIASQTPVSIICDRVKLFITDYRLLSDIMLLKIKIGVTHEFIQKIPPGELAGWYLSHNPGLRPVLLHVHSHALIDLAILINAGIDQINRTSSIAVAVNHIHEF